MTLLPILPRLTLALAATLALVAPALAAEDYSPAERALFMTNHLAGTKPPATLRYSFAHRGSEDEAFEDKVAVKLKAAPGGKCCAAEAEFLTGTRRLALPDMEKAEGNPVVLYFLERDIREMNRLTKGQQNYFRKRIRMAVYQGATIADVTVSYRGKEVPAREIRIAPYLDDPLRARFEKYANKTYVFTLSDAVPGGLYAIRTRVAGATPEAAPLIADEMVVDGGTP
ncbi:hypothetical protein [Piscinibacter sp.]|uniref:hypothetical protein n=1 Tax=Piscinibacter sp. TaxID=1903157 RepID=UPI001B62AC4E|nr:hypothetical protein [Piscinibacter sp.]MBP5988942.1 hypothetical protein [Piscinibacter sp.]MBP6026338.1 hypothetical protein [Piscinibacter sp.]